MQRVLRRNTLPPYDVALQPDSLESNLPDSPLFHNLQSRLHCSELLQNGQALRYREIRSVLEHNIQQYQEGSQQSFSKRPSSHCSRARAGRHCICCASNVAIHQGQCLMNSPVLKILTSLRIFQTPNWQTSVKVAEFSEPKTWMLVYRRASDQDDQDEEVVLIFQGIITDKHLPPFTERPRWVVR